MAQQSSDRPDPLPPSPKLQRAKFTGSLSTPKRPLPRKQSSPLSLSGSYQSLDTEDHEMTSESRDATYREASGRGLTNIYNLPHSTRPGPTGSKESLKNAKGGAEHPLSPSSPYDPISQQTTAHSTPLKIEDFGDAKLAGAESPYSPLREPFNKTLYETESKIAEQSPQIKCPTDGDILKDRWSRYTVTILVLALYSTVFSGILLGIAVARTQWSGHIGTNKRLTPANALVLSASISKTVELSFVTVFVALLGQVLSRKAVSRTGSSTSSGISIAEMNMRSWIMQPGTLFTRWSAVRYASSTGLGLAAMLAALAAAFFITAAEALVSPKLRYSPMAPHQMVGRVAAGFGNNDYLTTKCKDPVLETNSSVTDTCVQIEHAGQSSNNLYLYMSTWNEYAHSSNISSTSSTSTALSDRPPPFGLFYDNTTATGQFIISNENTIANSTGRLVQNVTLAMPHTNVFHAARYPKSRILQPSDLEGQGEYVISASVPAPAMNVLCVGLSTEEVEPFISLEPNVTAVDDFFYFGEKFGDQKQPAPYFTKVPLPYNTVANASNGWGPEAIYLLGTPPVNAQTDDHVLCSLRAMMYSDCTTRYHVADSGGELSVHCGHDSENTDSYQNSGPLIPIASPSKDWMPVGSAWIKAVALNDGALDADASIARFITESIPNFNPKTRTYELNPLAPSIGENLGVFAACTLLLSAEDAPFVHYWNHSGTTFNDDHVLEQVFPAHVKYKDYFSGYSQKWQGIFYIILCVVFFFNLFALIFLVMEFARVGQMTDITEPANLFALAINSPPSSSLRGSCGAGPNGSVLGKKWQVDMEIDDSSHGGEAPSTFSGTSQMKHPHFFIKCADDGKTVWEDNHPPLKKKQSHPMSMRSLWMDESPAVGQFKRLSGI